MFIDDIDGGPGSVRNKAERRKVLRRVYGDAADRARRLGRPRPHRRRDRSAARARPGAGRAVLPEPQARLRGRRVRHRRRSRRSRSRARSPRRRSSALGVDGARHDDAIAVIATHVQDRLPVAGDHPRAPAARPRGLRARLRGRSTAPSRRSSSATWSGAATATTSTSARLVEQLAEPLRRSPRRDLAHEPAAADRVGGAQLRGRDQLAATSRTTATRSSSSTSATRAGAS